MNKQSLSCKGYSGSWEVSHEDNCLFGKILFIEDLITYEADTPKELETSFRAAVDHYLEHCQRTGRPPNKPAVAS